QNPRSCMIVPTRKMLWYEPITQIVPDGFKALRAAISQARVKSSYAAKLENLSQSSSTASTLLSSGRFRSPWSWRLYGGSAKIRSTELAGKRVISATQSPVTIREGAPSRVKRGVLLDAPRRDTRMTYITRVRGRRREYLTTDK